MDENKETSKKSEKNQQHRRKGNIKIKPKQELISTVVRRGRKLEGAVDTGRTKIYSVPWTAGKKQEM